LSYCVVDAVWPIGSRYDEVVVPLVRRVAAANGDEAPVVATAQQLPVDPFPLPELLQRYPDVPTLLKITNGQRTSSRNGTLKAEAALRYARVLQYAGVHEMRDARRLIGDERSLGSVDSDLAATPGDGAFGIRRGYLWMLCGDDSGVKPDRMILRWLRRYGVAADPSVAAKVVRETACQLTHLQGESVTPWMVDHAIWRDERRRSRRGHRRLHRHK
jgi:hypothetical protein